MNKKNAEISLLAIPITLFLVASGCISMGSTAPIQAYVICHQQEEDKEHDCNRWQKIVTQSYSLEVACIKHKKPKPHFSAEDCSEGIAKIVREKAVERRLEEDRRWKAHWLAQSCRSKVTHIKYKKLQARLLAEGCSREVARKKAEKCKLEEDRKWEARRLAQSCRLEVVRIKHKKLTARWLAENCSREIAHKKAAERRLKENRKWQAHWLARSCKLEIARTKYRKLKARRLARSCRQEVILKKAREEQAMALISVLAVAPTQHWRLSRVDQRLREAASTHNLIKSNIPRRVIQVITGYTPEQIESLYTSTQKWDGVFLVAQERQLLKKEESMKKFLSMDYPAYLLKEDRDAAHDAIMNCNTISAIRMLGLADPNLAYPMRTQRVSELVDYLTKKQRAKTKNRVYKKLLADNWSIGCCIDSLNASFTSYEVERLKKIFCHPTFPIEAVRHIMQYDADLYLPGIFPPYDCNASNLSIVA